MRWGWGGYEEGGEKARGGAESEREVQRGRNRW